MSRVDLDAQRALFEASMRARGANDLTLGRRVNDGYLFHDSQICWETWQAALAAQAPTSRADLDAQRALQALRAAHDVLDGVIGDTSLDHFEDDEEEIEAAPEQYAARKIMEAMQILEQAAQAPVQGETVAQVCGTEYVMVRREAVDYLKKHVPGSCVESGLCERIGGRLYTRACVESGLCERIGGRLYTRACGTWNAIDAARKAGEP